MKVMMIAKMKLIAVITLSLAIMLLRKYNTKIEMFGTRAERTMQITLPRMMK